MSLDVYLTYPEYKPVSEARIYIRENGQNCPITREEWNAKFPGHEPVVLECERDVFEYNITHNLNTMADAAGIYHHLWRPEEIGITKAAQLIEPLEKGLALLIAEPEQFKVFNPPNGWGNYEEFVQFVRAYLEACKARPDAEVRASR